MSRNNTIRVGVVGLGFGKSWVPVYRDHPNVEYVAVCEPNEALLAQVADEHGIERRFTDLRTLIQTGEYDAVHLLTPIPLHVEQTLALLESGIHCACAIPMAMSLEEIKSVVKAQRASGKNYMMMETAAYSREILYVKDLYARGELGELQFLRGAHYQNMEGWPEYWMGLPPMVYSSHALGPLLSLAGKPVSRVHCLGSGRLPEAMTKRYGNPYPVQTALFQLEGSDVVCEVTRCLFQMTRGFQERFSAYGDKIGFEWPQISGEKPALFKAQLGPLEPGQRSRPTEAMRVDVPDFTDRLPTEIAKHRSFFPHLVHEFVRSIIEERPPAIDAETGANWIAAGLCAHESAMAGGEGVDVPHLVGG